MITTIVPVSGGKDSQVVLSMALKNGKRVHCVHQDTGWDSEKTYSHLLEMERFYGVTIDRTTSKYSGMLGFLETAGYFPNSAARGCTQRLKQEPFANWLIENNYNKDNCEIWFGMRSDESSSRAQKYGGLSKDDVFELSDISSFYGKGKIKHLGKIPVRLPIVDLVEDEVFGYLSSENAPLNELYKIGHKRVGCYPCLLARKQEWQACGQTKEGVEHISSLIDLEDKWREEGNPRKFIKVHRVWDVRGFIDPSLNIDNEDLSQEECGFCSI